MSVRRECNREPRGIHEKKSAPPQLNHKTLCASVPQWWKKITTETLRHGESPDVPDAAERPKLSHAGPSDVNRAAELKTFPGVGCSDLLGNIGPNFRSHLNSGPSLNYSTQHLGKRRFIPKPG